MKSLRGLLLLLLFFHVPAWAQGVRMSADFLPLEVGRRWTYDVTNDAGQKVGQLAFGVEEYTIVSGASYYVLDEFPFSTETGEPIRFVRYDRTERFFIRKARNAEGPLFLGDGAVTEVTESDSAGAPQRFVLRMDKMALTFQRGVGIVEAKMEKSGSMLTAKLTSVPASPVAGPVAVPRAPAARTPATPVPADKDRVLTPPPVATNRRESPVATVTSQNPRVDVAASPTADGFQITMVVVNVSDKILPFRFSSGQSYDFVIQDAASGKEVWKWSNDNFFTQVVRSDSIPASGKWQFEVTWNRKDNDGKPVPAGQYRLTGIVTSLPAVRAVPIVLDLR